MVKRSDDKLDAVFHALADPTRREIIGLLAQRELSIGEMVPSFQMSFVAVSKHIKTLERAGIVVREVRGRHHICTLDASVLRTASRWLSAYEQFWNESLDNLAEVLKDMKEDGRQP